MGNFSFGQRSRNNLTGVHPKLITVAERALAISPIDFFVNEGVRSPKRQAELYAQGRSKPGKIVTWTLKSNHFLHPRTGFGHAIDVYAHPYNGNQSAATSRLIAEAFLRASNELDIPVRWGADWDRDGVFYEKGESDSPHFELWGIS
jgi:peptidoglycan L-alanyl-D-glutamate endopeptidase CwlK